MTDRIYLLRLKRSEMFVAVVAKSVEIHGEHIALLNSKGKLAALFLSDAVEGWSVLSFS